MRDVRDLTTRDWQLFIEKLTRKRSDLSSSTRNMLMATFRNVLKIARDDGLIDLFPPRRVSARRTTRVRSFGLIPSFRKSAMNINSCSKEQNVW